MSQQSTKQGWRLDLTDEEVLFIRRGLTKESLDWLESNAPLAEVLKKLHENFIALENNWEDRIDKTTLNPMRLTFQGNGSLEK